MFPLRSSCKSVTCVFCSSLVKHLGTLMSLVMLITNFTRYYMYHRYWKWNGARSIAFCW